MSIDFENFEPYFIWCRLKIHRWTKWGPLDIGARYPAVDGNIHIEGQLRICQHCGEWQVKKRVVKGGNIGAGAKP